jgi:hypothetical protein
LDHRFDVQYVECRCSRKPKEAELGNVTFRIGGRTVSTQTYWESIRANGTLLLDTFKTLLREGNVRRVIIKQDGRPIAEFPLTVGVVGAALAPPLAAVGAIAALITECTIEVERTTEETDRKDQGAA